MKGGSSPHHPRQPSSGHSLTAARTSAPHDLGADALAPQGGERPVERDRRVDRPDAVDEPAVERREESCAPPIGASKLTYVPAA